MRTISLRAFRVQISELTEPVTVVMRKDGDLVTLGTWQPVGAADPVVDMVEGRLVERHQPRPFTPAPKPGKR